MKEFLSCTRCGDILVDAEGQLSCLSCQAVFGWVEDSVAIFDGAIDKENFFDKRAVERLSAKYEGYDRTAFLRSLEHVTLWEMDEVNKKVGIAKKFWWEPYIGKVERKSVLEVGCGVNYIVPYWLFCGNDVIAFDICKENVTLLRSILRKIGIQEDNISCAVADAQTIQFNRVFDVINISNVLHHIQDKRAVLTRARECLADEGKLLVVEPNYYYPPRWIIETNIFDPFNFIKEFCVRNDLVEKGEKAIIFSKLKSDLRETGFKLEVVEKDINYLGYFTTHWLAENSPVARLTFDLDRLVFSRLLPRIWTPFEYIVASKA